MKLRDGYFLMIEQDNTLNLFVILRKYGSIQVQL